ncbi:MAG: HEAT repeat domain-containing protein [bacterium]
MMKTRHIMLLALLPGLLLAGVKEDVDRLFMQASDGGVKHVDLVQPSKDSLIAMGDSAAKYLAAKLSSDDARERHTLVDIYKGIGKVSTPYLVAALNTENEDQLRTTCGCLAEVKDPNAVPDLFAVAQHESYTVRAEAIIAIGKTGGDDSVAAEVATWLGDTVDVVRKSAVAALGLIGAQRSLPDLAMALDDESFAVRLTARDALTKYGEVATETVNKLIKQNRSFRLKSLALRIAGELKLKETLPLVEESTGNADPLVRGWALWAWGRLRGPGSVERLRSLLVDERDLFVRSQIESTIDYLTAPAADE